MRVLIACEFSGIVRDAFRARGHDAWSCDLLPTERPGQHLQDDVTRHLSGFDLLNVPKQPWDLLIAHPPCKFLNHAGVRWLYKDGRRWIKNKSGKIIGENPIDLARWACMEKAAQFFLSLLNADIPRIAVENSEMHPHAVKIIGRKSDFEIQPWEHGHGEVKASHFWTKNLPPLVPSNVVAGRTPRVHHASPGPERWKERSRTLPGIAAAMAEQWTI